MESNNNSLANRQSTLIKAMRFPLIVLVVFSHSLGFLFPHIDFSLEGWNIYHFFSEMFSHNLCKIAVCWFFVIAGYFFFLNLPDEGLNGKWLMDKWKRRIMTLLIPYLIWNILPIIAYLIKTYLFTKLGITPVESIKDALSLNFNPLYWFLTGPQNYPLWFMRDLMIMCLLSPFVYLLFKKLPGYGGIIILLILFLLPFEVSVLTWRGYFFFSLGAFLGIRQLNILSLCRRIKLPASILAAIFLLVATIFNDASFHDWLLRFFYPFGMITFMNIIDSLIDNKSCCDKLCKLSATVFFIYASHEIYILGWTKGLLLRLFGESLAGTWVRYLLVPIVVVCVCLLLYYILNKIIPRSLAFVCGGRTQKQLRLK